MSARPLLLVPWLALALLARVLSGPAQLDLPPVEAARTPAVTNPCGSDACGCPHDAVNVSCCCAPESAAPRRPAPPRVRTPEDLRASAGHDVLGPRLVDFACGGGPAPRAAGGSRWIPADVPPVVEPRPRDGARRQVVCVEVDPPFDLGREPAAPPPRAGKRA